MVIRLAFVSCLLVACTSDGKTAIDAPVAAIDAPHTVVDSSTLVDAAATVCTGALYDACTGAAGNCMSGMCKAFGAAGFSVCTQACSASNPCPAQGGTAIPCNGMGICRPTAANACTPP